MISSVGERDLEIFEIVIIKRVSEGRRGEDKSWR
jgi:hypothetical protein